MPEMTPFPWFRAGGGGSHPTVLRICPACRTYEYRNKILSGGDLSHYPSASLY